MANQLKLGDREVGRGNPCFVIAEIGINHNGDLELARQLISAAADAGADAVKFQKRTIDVVYGEEELARPRESPFGTTNGDLKRGLEFSMQAYAAIDEHCRSLGILWTASCWDEASVEFIANFAPAFYKIASASLTDDSLLRAHRRHGVPLIASTGMSTAAEVRHAVGVMGTEDLALLHTTSMYPAEPDDVNLLVIPQLAAEFGVPVGYSGHEAGILQSIASIALGACIVERHLTLDRGMWGSDHAASIEPDEFRDMVQGIRVIEASMGNPEKVLLEGEVPVRDKLRRVG